MDYFIKLTNIYCIMTQQEIIDFKDRYLTETNKDYCTPDELAAMLNMTGLNLRKKLRANPSMFNAQQDANGRWKIYKSPNYRRLQPTSSKQVEQPSNSKIESLFDTPSLITSNGRKDSDETYVIDICDEVLGLTASRQHRFDFLVGDTGTKLPVDAYYKDLDLVVEYCESQHTESTPFFDNKPTVSGIPRGEQRKRYDRRRVEVLPKYEIKLISISYREFGDSKKIKRDHNTDKKIITHIFKQNKIL